MLQMYKDASPQKTCAIGKQPSGFNLEFFVVLPVQQIFIYEAVSRNDAEGVYELLALAAYQPAEVAPVAWCLEDRQVHVAVGQRGTTVKNNIGIEIAGVNFVSVAAVWLLFIHVGCRYACCCLSACHTCRNYAQWRYTFAEKRRSSPLTSKTPSC